MNNFIYGGGGATPQFYLSVGRFFIPIYETYKGSVSAPWLIAVLFILWMALTGTLMTSMLKIDSSVCVAFACGLLCCNVTCTLLGATYVYCMDEYAFALLFATVAAFLFTRGGRFAILGLFPLYISLGIYQAYATVTLVLCLFDILCRTRNESRLSPILRQGVFYLLLLLAGYWLYRTLWDALLSARGVSRFRDAAALQDFPPMERLKLANSMFFDFLFHNQTILAQWVFRINVVLLLFLLWHLYRALSDKQVPLPNRILFLGMFSLLPTAFYSVALLVPEETHGLTLFARELLYILPLCVLDAFPKHDTPKRVIPLERGLIFVVLACLLWQHIVFANQAYMKKDLEKTSTAVLATRLIDRIESVPGYVSGQTGVAFVTGGSTDVLSAMDVNISAFQDIETEVGLQRKHAATYNLARYLTVYLQYPLLITRVPASDLINEMPLFPAPDSVRMIDGVVVVKLSA